MNPCRAANSLSLVNVAIRGREENRTLGRAVPKHDSKNTLPVLFPRRSDARSRFLGPLRPHFASIMDFGLRVDLGSALGVGAVVVVGLKLLR